MSERPPEAVLWDFLRGATMTRALAIASDLRIADALAGGPQAVDELARQTGADADVLHRLLRALASDGVFTEEEPGVFANTRASETLGTAAWSAFAHLFGGIWHRPVGELDAAAGEPAFERIFGAQFWGWLADHQEERAAFDRAMGGERKFERLAKVTWRGDETVVDVGGGNGSLLIELLRHQPGLRGIVFDLPETVRDEATFGDRLEFVAGSFFDSVPRGDAYVLSTILHDWDDERAAAILRTIRVAARAGARLIALEAVIPSGNEPHGSKWLDLLMLALFNGRERDEAQWRTLLESTGFEPVRMEDGLVEARCQPMAQ